MQFNPIKQNLILTSSNLMLQPKFANILLVVQLTEFIIAVQLKKIFIICFVWLGCVQPKQRPALQSIKIQI
jgi:hypothetical protein